jgi:hypothetical protein
MTQLQSALSDLADQLVGTDATLSTALAEIVAAALQELIEAELTARIGAEAGERTPLRTNLRNGHRPKLDRYYGRIRRPPDTNATSRLITGYRHRHVSDDTQAAGPGRASPVPVITI